MFFAIKTTKGRELTYCKTQMSTTNVNAKGVKLFINDNGGVFCSSFHAHSGTRMY